MLIRFLVLVLAAFGAQAQDFKGLPLGADKAELLAKFRGLTCRKPPPQFWSLGEEHCTSDGADAGLRTYAGAPAWDFYFSIVGGRVEGFGAAVSASSYTTIRAALADVYGAGQETTREVQTVGGAQLVSRSWSATGPKGQISVFEHAASVREGAVGATSEVYRAWKASKPNVDAKKNAKDV